MISLSKKRCLLDTNILVALVNKSHPHHKKSGEIFGKVTNREFQAVVSSQNLLELSAVLVHGYKEDRDKAADLVSRFASDELIEVVYPDFLVMEKFFSLMKTDFEIHITDLYLVATCIFFQVDILISADKALGKEKIKDLAVYNPFLD